jgi:hypothetical protein
MNEHQIPLLPFDPCPDLAEYIRANLPRPSLSERLAECVKSCDPPKGEAEALRARWLANGGCL